MTDLISRQALCEYALNQKDKSITPNEIMRFPSAEPVRHGKWKNDCMGVLHCSECNTQAPWKYGRGFIDYRWESNFCPNCGARMDKE